MTEPVRRTTATKEVQLYVVWRHDDVLAITEPRYPPSRWLYFLFNNAKKYTRNPGRGGDGNRTHNRRFWRPVLYLVKLLPKKHATTAVGIKPTLVWTSSAHPSIMSICRFHAELAHAYKYGYTKRIALIRYCSSGRFPYHYHVTT
jgi:hypothetical protein